MFLIPKFGLKNDVDGKIGWTQQANPPTCPKKSSQDRDFNP